MLEAANTELFNPLLLTIVYVKIHFFLYKLSQFNPFLLTGQFFSPKCIILIKCYKLHCYNATCYINPLVPDAHYSEHQDKPFSLQIQRLEVVSKLNCGFLFFAPWGLMG